MVELIAQTEFDCTAANAGEVVDGLEPWRKDLICSQIRDATKVLFDRRPNWAKHAISPRPAKTD